MCCIAHSASTTNSYKIKLNLLGSLEHLQGLANVLFFNSANQLMAVIILLQALFCSRIGSSRCMFCAYFNSYRAAYSYNSIILINIRNNMNNINIQHGCVALE